MSFFASNKLDCPTRSYAKTNRRFGQNLSTEKQSDCPVLRKLYRHAGFTLLEVIIAIAIFSLVALGANALLSTVNDSNKLSQSRSEQLEELQRAMLIMERDFLQMQQRIPRVQGIDNELVINGGEFEFESDAYGVGFVRSGWRNPELRLNRSHLQNVVYRLQESRLERLHTNYVDSVIGTEPKVRVLLHGVSDFKIEVLNELSTQMRWSDTIENTQLPVAISVTLTSNTFGEIKRVFMVAI